MSSPPSIKRKINAAIVTPEPASVRRKTNCSIDTPKTGPYGTVMAATYAQSVMPTPGMVVKVKGKYIMPNKEPLFDTWFYGVTVAWDEKVFKRKRGNQYIVVEFVGDGELHVKHDENENGIVLTTVQDMSNVTVLLTKSDNNNASLPIDDYGFDPVRFFEISRSSMGNQKTRR